MQSVGSVSEARDYKLQAIGPEGEIVTFVPKTLGSGAPSIGAGMERIGSKAKTLAYESQSVGSSAEAMG